ncbi:uncharacterized protein PGTG_09506 [Puccinia graminis f. sp. tritici CRL 75-36-700-3]|uniref:Uncharacterized protein n=1 Tax=Puccinia graminis f. sp. tritici (strain CRL 75-36-700-3 / race SCCL) TaxID=418459 RepID=E3KHL8_PUCGT|nr:uncharacterized protein PGTG_09506 [Puccinia graminis f. sp. tritici CRL 75-36-700-3]EFP83793.2 hypothetical protein PGTG_09506 [Puccinia graminis f. sp. tritici CRL 75-36-700-3]
MSSNEIEMAPQDTPDSLVNLSVSVGHEEPAPITPPPRSNHRTPSPDDTSRGPNPSIDIWIRYRFYSDVQIVGESETLYKRITNRGPMPPMDLHFKDMTLSLFKTFVFEHLRNESKSKYPIDMIATQAERAAVLHWAYMVEEPNGSNWSTAHPVPMADFQDFQRFIRAAENSSCAAKVAIYLEMPEDTNKSDPWAVLTLIVHPGRTRGGRVVVGGNQSERSPDERTVAGSTKHLLEPDDLPSPKRPSLEFAQIAIQQRDTPSLNIDAFLTLCEIPLDYQPIRDVIAKHDIFHWTAFEGATEQGLLNLGLKWGPVQSILYGVKKAVQYCQPQY